MKKLFWGSFLVSVMLVGSLHSMRRTNNPHQGSMWLRKSSKSEQNRIKTRPAEIAQEKKQRDKMCKGFINLGAFACMGALAGYCFAQQLEIDEASYASTVSRLTVCAGGVGLLCGDCLNRMNAKKKKK